MARIKLTGTSWSHTEMYSDGEVVEATVDGEYASIGDYAVFLDPQSEGYESWGGKVLAPLEGCSTDYDEIQKGDRLQIEFKDIEAGDTITEVTTVTRWDDDRHTESTRKVTGVAHTYTDYSGVWTTPQGWHLTHSGTRAKYILNHRETPKKDVPTALGSVVGDPGYEGHRLVKLDNTDAGWLGYTGNQYESRWVSDDRVSDLLNEHGWVEIQL